MFLCAYMLYGQDSPTSYTSSYGFGKWAQAANPGATGLNNNWDAVDVAIKGVGDSTEVLYGWFLTDHVATTGIHGAGVIEWTMLSASARANIVTVGATQTINGQKIFSNGITWSGKDGYLELKEDAGANNTNIEGTIWYSTATDLMTWVTGTGVDTTASRAYARSQSGSYVALVGGGTVTSGDITVNDNVEINIGTGNDLVMYHTGVYSAIEAQQNDMRLSYGQSTLAILLDDSEASVQLYWGQEEEKLSTAATGIEVTGDVDISDDLRVIDDALISGELTVGQLLHMNEGKNITLGTGNDLTLSATGTTATIDIAGGSDLEVRNQQGETMVFVDDAGSVSLYQGQSAKKFETTSTGIDVTGNVATDDVTTTDDAIIGDDLTVAGNSDVEGLTIYGLTVHTMTAGEFATNVMDITGVSLYHLDDYTSATTLYTLTGGVQGQILYLCGGSSVTNTITFTDNASPSADQMNLSGDFVMSSYDCLTLMFTGTYWQEISRSDN